MGSIRCTGKLDGKLVSSSVELSGLGARRCGAWMRRDRALGKERKES